MHGPTCIFWANLTPVSLRVNKWRTRALLLVPTRPDAEQNLRRSEPSLCANALETLLTAAAQFRTVQCGSDRFRTAGPPSEPLSSLRARRGDASRGRVCHKVPISTERAKIHIRS